MVNINCDVVAKPYLTSWFRFLHDKGAIVTETRPATQWTQIVTQYNDLIDNERFRSGTSFVQVLSPCELLLFALNCIAHVVVILTKCYGNVVWMSENLKKWLLQSLESYQC